MNMVFWNRLPEGFQGAPIPIEVNVLTVLIPIALLGFVAYKMFSKRQRQHHN